MLDGKFAEYFKERCLCLAFSTYFSLMYKFSSGTYTQLAHRFSHFIRLMLLSRSETQMPAIFGQGKSIVSRVCRARRRHSWKFITRKLGKFARTSENLEFPSPNYKHSLNSPEAPCSSVSHVRLLHTSHSNVLQPIFSINPLPPSSLGPPTFSISFTSPVHT